MQKLNFKPLTKAAFVKNIQGYLNAHCLEYTGIHISADEFGKTITPDLVPPVHWDNLTIAISFKQDYIIGPDFLEDLLIRITNCQWPDSNPQCKYLDLLPNGIELYHDLSINRIPNHTYIIKIQNPKP